MIFSVARHESNSLKAMWYSAARLDEFIFNQRSYSKMSNSTFVEKGREYATYATVALAVVAVAAASTTNYLMPSPTASEFRANSAGVVNCNRMAQPDFVDITRRYVSSFRPDLIKPASRQQLDSCGF
jgi:hypothetical protein